VRRVEEKEMKQMLLRCPDSRVSKSAICNPVLKLVLGCWSEDEKKVRSLL
jgi:hypothetical protein